MSNGERGGRDGQFSLPRPTFGLFFPIFTGVPTFVFPRERARGPLALQPQQPVPTTRPFGTPPFFPDQVPLDIPRIEPRPGGLIGLGGLIITIADVLRRVIEGEQLEDLGDIIRRQDAEIADIQKASIDERLEQEKALRVEKQVRALESAPETFELPTSPAPLRLPPAPVLAPDFDFPDVIAIPFPSQVPDVGTVPDLDPLEFPDPLQIPAPVPPASPRVSPVPAPVDAPFGIPTDLPIPKPFTIADPVTTPLGDPVPTSPLTPQRPVVLPSTPLQTQFDVRTQPFQFADPASPADTADPDTRCKRKCDEQEIRSQCFKGLYRESVNATSFTEWTEIDCTTGKELESTGVAGSIASEIVGLL